MRVIQLAQLLLSIVYTLNRLAHVGSANALLLLFKISQRGAVTTPRAAHGPFLSHVAANVAKSHAANSAAGTRGTLVGTGRPKGPADGVPARTRGGQRYTRKSSYQQNNM